MIRRAFDLPLCREIASFLHHHPSTVDTVSGIASRLGLCRREVGEAIRDMVEAGIVHNWGAVWNSPGYMEDTDVFTYTRDPWMRGVVSEQLALPDGVAVLQ